MFLGKDICTVFILFLTFCSLRTTSSEETATDNAVMCYRSHCYTTIDTKVDGFNFFHDFCPHPYLKLEITTPQIMQELVQLEKEYKITNFVLSLKKSDEKYKWYWIRDGTFIQQYSSYSGHLPFYSNGGIHFEGYGRRPFMFLCMKDKSPPSSPPPPETEGLAVWLVIVLVCLLVLLVVTVASMAVWFARRRRKSETIMEIKCSRQGKKSQKNCDNSYESVGDRTNEDLKVTIIGKNKETKKTKDKCSKKLSAKLSASDIHNDKSTDNIYSEISGSEPSDLYQNTGVFEKDDDVVIKESQKDTIDKKNKKSHDLEEDDCGDNNDVRDDVSDGYDSVVVEKTETNNYAQVVKLASDSCDDNNNNINCNSNDNIGDPLMYADLEWKTLPNK